MAIGRYSESRNLPAHNRLQKRRSVRRVLLETLEPRHLMAVGPQLIGIQPNTGDLLQDGEILHVSPRELVFRFNDGAGIDPLTLGGIRVVRSGDDGVFERASIATDFGTGGQTLVEFYAQTPGQAGNGIELRFTAVSRTDSRVPVLRVSGRRIDVELNSNPALQTRVEDVLRAFDRNAGTPATNLVFALPLRGSQTIGIGSTTDTSRSLVLSGANAAKGSTNFGLTNNLEVRFVARDGGSTGLGTSVSVTRVDRGGAGAPTVTVSGKTINVVLNSNPLNATTAREFVDAINANVAASSLIEAQLVSGSGATRIGAAATSYSPIKLSGVTDIEIVPGYIGLGDSNREVVLRFAEALPDDSYRIEILGQGIRTLKNVAGEPFNMGASASVAFELQLGAQILSVVPQPVTKDATTGALSWNRREEIDVYFSHDALIDVDSIVSVNGVSLTQLRAERGGVLYFQNTDVIVFSGGVTQRGAINPQYYQLINSKGTLTTADDAAVVLPTRVRYYPEADRVSLRFERDLSTYAEAGGELRLRIGTNEARPLPPVTVDGLTTDPADTFANATNLNASWTPGAGGSQAVIINSKIENTTQTPLDFPGGNDEPGNRTNLFQANVVRGADSVNGIDTIFYNFQGALGQTVNGTPNVNAITELQKQRVREVFSLYEKYLGARFVETDNLGLTVAVGDTRAVRPFEDVQGSGGTGVIDINGPGNIYYEAGVLASNLQPATVLDIQDFSDSNLSGFGGPFQRAAMQGIGRLLGLGLADEVAQLTVQSFDGAFLTPGVGSEIVFPGNADIVHGQYLYRPDSKDIDLYQFTLPVAGRISIEAFAERMSQASLLDSQIRLFQQTSGGWKEIAANDDYFSSDSFLQLDLSQGNYIVGVSASGNDLYNPVIGDTGLGGKSQGNYQLRVDFQPPAPSVLRDADSLTGTEIDGDADGQPGGTFNFWFKPSTDATTKFVDKSAAAGGNGSIGAPYTNISTALAAATAGTVVRVVGNGGADKNFATHADNLAYEIGFNALGQPLPDGATLDVPKNVTLMIDAGAILKLRRARVGVGSTSVNVDRSGGALLVLGTPTLQTASGSVLKDAAGNPIAGSVYMTSLNDTTIGKTATAVNVAPLAGDWGGIDIRSRVDAANGRNRAEDQGIFFNWISNAELRYGGGQVVVDGTSQSITPVQMVDSRPTVVSSFITLSAEAALSATPDSFKESNFRSPAEQGNTATPFSVDYDRVGPDLHGNRIVGNSINGLQVRVRTGGGTQLEKMTVQGRFDDIDVVHFLPENLEIQGTAGGAVLIQTPPAAGQVQLTLQPGGTLPLGGSFTYIFSSVDSTGAEGVASNPSTRISVPFTLTAAERSIVLSNIPVTARNVYRSSANGQAPYTLIAQIAAGTSTVVDNGSDLGVALPSITGAVRSRLDARLVVDGGTIVKSTGSRIDVSMGSQLIAEGTAGNPVVFTSLNDSRYGVGGTFDTANRTGRLAAAEGDWGGIYVGHTSTASLDNVVLAYGGGTTRIEGGFSDFSALEIHQAEVRLANSRLEFNATGARTTTDAARAGRGFNEAATIFVRGAQPIIVDNIISNNLGPAMSFDVSSLNSVSLQDTGRSTGAIAKTDARPGNQGPLIAGNRIQNKVSNSGVLGASPINGLVVRRGNLTTESVWDDTDIVHVVQGEIIVPDFQHYGGLRLTSSAEQSLVVKFSGNDAGFTATGDPLDNADRIGGSIQIIGTPNYPVVLTSLADDSVGAGFTITGVHQVDTNNNGSVPGPGAPAPAAGNWRGLLLETYSNDRNVVITKERESFRAGAPAANDTTTQAQYLGVLAPNEKSGDENQRLGFQVGGMISAPGDVDVYSFNASAGTEVWLDIDRTENSLDTVVELVDADGRTLALSDSSLLEERDPTKLYQVAELAAQSVNPLRKSATAFYYQSALGEAKDLYSTNPKDAGLRVVLPGSAGSNNLYHIRVRSSNLNAGDAATKLLDAAQVHAGLTTGRYQLQVRLGEVDEIPGSAVTFGDIRYATTGVQLVGVPRNSPLLGENAEVEVSPQGSNDTLSNAQALGNLLKSNRQAISVAGNLDNFTDVDWFSFDLTYDKLTPVGLREYFSTIIDVDYADGIGRPDLSIYVFNSAGNLILGGLGSDLAGDQSSPTGGNSELDRGSAGIKDPYIGPYMLPTETQGGGDTTGNNIPAGRYFLAVTNSDRVPAVLAAYTDPNFTDTNPPVPGSVNIRMQPIEGIRLIAEDHIKLQGGSTAISPIVPILFPTPGDRLNPTTVYDTTNDAIIDYNLSDVVLYVSRDVAGLEETNLYIVNPFTGQTRNLVGNGNVDVRDIDFRPNGTLAGFDRPFEKRVPANTDDDTLTNFITIDAGTGVFTSGAGFGLQTSHLEFPAGGGAPTVAASDDGFYIEALTFAIVNGQERGIAVGSRPAPPGFEPRYEPPFFGTRFINNNGQPGFDRPGPSYFSNVIYEFDEETGGATSNPAADKQNLAVGLGAGTAIRDRGYIETNTIIGGNIVTQASELVTKQVTQATSTGANFLIRNGDSFTIQESGGALRRFEFDLGPEVQFNSSNPDTVLGVTDGMRFTIDGITYEFDTGAPAGVGVGAVSIPLAINATLRQFVDAVASRMPSGITVSFDGGRMNFAGATTGTFTQLQNAGILTNLGNPGTPGSFLVTVLASDTAAQVAIRIVDAINGSGLPGLIAAVNPTASDRVQLGNASTFQLTGPLSAFGVAPGGIVTGIAMLGNNVIPNNSPGAFSRMYAVSDAGGLYFVDNPLSFAGGNVATYVTTSYELTGIQFTGLVEGPVHAEHGALAQTLFGIARDGTIYAFDTSGRLLPIFANGATSVPTPLSGATGLTMPSLDFNLWHVSGNRNADIGHGLPATPNNSRVDITGGQSLYYGFQTPATSGTSVTGGLQDLTNLNTTGLNDSYNFPGGAAGAIESAPIDLSSVTAGSLPTLYFNYRFDTEAARADLPLGNNTDDYMRDSLRVYGAGEDGQWILLATNNDALPETAGNISNRGRFDDEFDFLLTGNSETQALFDNTGQFRQARVPLDVLAGKSNVRIRVEFSTYGGFGFGRTGGKGAEIRTISGDRLTDGESLMLNGQRFEVDMGLSLLLPSGAALPNGSSVTIEGVQYVFTDGTSPVVAPAVSVTISAAMDGNQIALLLQQAIRGAAPNVTVVSGLSFAAEGNDITARALATGITGDNIRVSGTGVIGDNAALANAGEDVDLFKMDLERGASVTIDVAAEVDGSTLDSYLRVFDADGTQLFSNNNRPGSTDSQLTFTAPTTGRYYIGVSGAGNQNYSPVIAGKATVGSTGNYRLIVNVLRALSPIVAGNRLQLDGAKNVSLPASSPVILQGARGASNGQPVRVTVDMTAAQVAASLQQSVANFFGGGSTRAYPVRDNVLDLTGLINVNQYDSFDLFSGQRTPSPTVFSPGPFGGTTNFIGDSFSAYNTGKNFDGSTNNANPGALGAQINGFEGIYLDDFIIGLAGRGEMVLNSTSTDTSFVADPQDGLANPSQIRDELEIGVGPYQFELRGGENYGVPLLPNPQTLFLTSAFEPDALQSPGLAIRFNSAASMVAGATFTLSDGTTVLTFEMDNTSDTVAVRPGNIAVPFSTAVLDPLTGNRKSESGRVIAARVRDLINSSAIQSRLNVSANLLNNDRSGATSDTLVLVGQASVNVPNSIGQTITSTRTGSSNRNRPQGQVVISGTKISNSTFFGVDIASPGRDPLTNASLLGSPRNTVTLNVDGLAPGAVVMNSQFIGNGSVNAAGNPVGGGISVSGEPLTAGLPRATVPFVRLVNNTILGGTVTGTPGAETYTAGGQGIVVTNNAAATLLNNVIANSSTAIIVDPSSSSTTINGTVYQRTVVGGTVFFQNAPPAVGSVALGQFPINVPAGTRLFVDPATGNLYPAPLSPLIDSSIDSLQDRTSLVAVKQPLGIAASPILAPQFDINGQLRADDPAVETPAGLGENVFKDRGAQDRADFVGPSVVLINPVDNDFDGLDGNPVQGIVELTGGMLNYFDIHLVDGLEPSDPSLGSGVDHSTVTSSSVLIYGPKVVNGVRQQSQPLIEGRDYVFGYDSTNGIVRLTPLAGIWEPEAVYTIRFLNSAASAVVAQPTYTDGQQVSVVDSNNTTTIFEVDFGYVVTVPAPPTDPTTLDGKTFTVDDGALRVVFEIDTNGIVTTGNFGINIASATTPESVARLIENAIKSTALNVTITEIAPGQLQIQGSSQVQFDPVDSGLLVAGKTGVQTAYGIQIPLRAGVPFGLVDGQTFTINRTGTPVIFELDSNGAVVAGNNAVTIAAGATADAVATALITAINAAALGLTPVNAGNGLVTIGGDASTVLDMSQTVLRQSGLPGQPAAIAIPVSLATTQSSDSLALLLKQAIDAQNLPGVVTTLFGDRILIEGAQSAGGVGAAAIAPIRDLAGNPLKANQADGTTTLTVFMGEGLDYGDAPAPYKSLSTDNGPRHKVVNGLSLGATVTPDADARLPNADSDDGVTIGTLFAAFASNATISVTNTSGGPAYVSMWIDFDGNGIFADSERVVSSQAVTAASTTVTFVVPRSTSDETTAARAKLGATYARVRVSSSDAAVASPLGAAPDGEVEDFAVTILANPLHNASGITDGFGNGLDVSGDGFVSPIDVLQVINWINDPAKPQFPTLADATGAPPYVDVNGDGIISALDSSILITYLNSLPRVTGSGEGEGSLEVASVTSSGLMGEGEQVVLSSNWAGGLEDVLRPRVASRSETTVSARDQALLETDEDNSELAVSVASVVATQAVDTFWASLSETPITTHSIVDELEYGLIEDLLG